MIRNKKNKGFTLIELLVVVAIIGLLASFTTIALGSTRAKARNAKRKADAHQIITALHLYYSTAQEFPHDGTVGASDTPTDISNLASFLVPTYMPMIPNDPLYTISNYQYVWGNGGRDFGLLIPFSNDEGSDCQFDSPGSPSTWFTTTSGGGNNGNGNGNNGNGNGNGGNTVAVPFCNY